MSTLIPVLKKVKELAEVPEEQLAWIEEREELLTIKNGDFLFKKGDSMDYLFIIFQGKFSIKVEQGSQFRNVGGFEPYSITGMLPYSRAVAARGYADSRRGCKILDIDGKN